MAGAVQMKSFVKISMDHFASSVSHLQTLNPGNLYEWHLIVDKAQIAARTNFNLFKSQYLGGGKQGVTKKLL